MDEEGALDAHFQCDAAHGEALARSATSPSYDDALEDLGPLPVAFLNLDRYLWTESPGRKSSTSGLAATGAR